MFMESFLPGGSTLLGNIQEFFVWIIEDSSF